MRLIAVAEAERGRGLGGLLLQGWLDDLPDHVEYVILDASPSDGHHAEQRLRGFYERHGFRLLPLPEGYSTWEPYLMGWSRPGIWLPEAEDRSERDNRSEEDPVPHEPSDDERAYIDAYRAMLSPYRAPESPDR